MSRKPDLQATTPSLPPERAAAIRAQVERILSSQQFRGSRRCLSLLRHIVEHTVTGDTAQLKERTLGIEVFEREPDYDTSQDPVVRATAGEIRKKLAQYYQEPGHQSELRIDLLAGSYIAEFHDSVTPPPAARRDSRLWIKIGLSIAGAAVVVLVLTLLSPRWKETELQRLWQPLLKAPGTIIISLGQPIVYNLKSTQAQDAIQGFAGTTPPSSGPEPDFILKKDLVILPDRYAAMGDVICLVHIAGMLEKNGKPYRIRGERSTTFADLRETPAVLIGAFDNQWTLLAVGQLRFIFEKDDTTATDFVRDRQHPENNEWKLTGAWPYWDVKNDYAIVSRIVDTTTDRPVVIAAGITHYGTMAAGEFLTNPEYFAEAVAKLPRGWEHKNVQFVLRIPVVNRVSGHPQVLAAQVW
ncbi:MAG: hypothetical protein ABSH56_02175 [Bryobacteraceae bacterium]|jgi:hypothetical protein